MRHQDYQEVAAFFLIQALDNQESQNITITRKTFETEEVLDEPGIAVINPTSPYKEMIAFAGVGEWNRTLVLRGVVRGVELGPFAHQAGAEVYLDQGEQYARISEESRKEILKRCLRTLIH